MILTERLISLRKRALDNAKLHIFPFWCSEYIMDKENGGFYSTVTLDMKRENTEHRSLVLTGRMVYAYAHAFMQFGDEIYIDRAKYTYDYLMKHFYDRELGGAYSFLDKDGKVVSDEKPLYSEAFFIMACAAYYHATRDPEALRAAMETFDIIETKVKRGAADYPNNLARDWTPVQKLSTGRMSFPPDAIVFPHHLMQAYDQLYRATKDPRVKSVLHELAQSVTDLLYDKERHNFCTFFDADRKRLGNHQSFGHDCELSYLAMDVARLTGDKALIESVAVVCEDVLRNVMKNDFDPWHSLYNGENLETGERDKSHVWWAQAEAVTAMLFGYQLTGDEAFLQACEDQLEYIEKYFINHKDGDWFNNVVVDETGYQVVDGMHGFDKLNGGKCPFHNSHMCFEVIRRVEEILKQ